MRDNIDNDHTQDIIPLPNVTGGVLAKVIEYCTYHADAKKVVDGTPCKSDEEIKVSVMYCSLLFCNVLLTLLTCMQAWDADFIDVEQDVLFDIILAANYMNLGSLLELACQKVASVGPNRSLSIDGSIDYSTDIY